MYQKLRSKQFRNFPLTSCGKDDHMFYQAAEAIPLVEGALPLMPKVKLPCPSFHIHLAVNELKENRIRCNVVDRMKIIGFFFLKSKEEKKHYYSE